MINVAPILDIYMEEVKMENLKLKVSELSQPWPSTKIIKRTDLSKRKSFKEKDHKRREDDVGVL